ncbi:undecaprenyl/decaprenyl-phosphate alpha-N-acetylglucosaminyl 1-phosphate transferase [bacterium]|nr:undecaprenyl/decaprenyl-phosphate alpha-N-acetylglucosaminyl 1-phosphate transferase [bacterium]
MPDITKFIFVFVFSALLSFVLSKLVILVARKFNILDHPRGERKIHDQPVPLLGGLAIYFSFVITILVLWQSNQLLDERMSLSLIWWFLLAGFILMVNGFLDDKFSLPPYITVWGPILATVMVIIAGLQITYITHPDGGVLYLNNLIAPLTNLAEVIPMVITFLWLLGITYTTKLLDGIDGLTGGIGLVASIIIFIVSLSWDVVGSTTSLLSLSLGGAILGFLILNWHPAKVFLGEGGSTFIGFALGVLAIISGSKIATALLVMGLPVLDIIWVVFMRLKRGQSVWRGDRQHLHFRLLLAGLSQRKIVIFLSAISLCFGVISILFTNKIKIGALAVIFVLMALLSIWLNYKTKQENYNQ